MPKLAIVAQAAVALSASTALWGAEAKVAAVAIDPAAGIVSGGADTNIDMLSTGSNPASSATPASSVTDERLAQASTVKPPLIQGTDDPGPSEAKGAITAIDPAAGTVTLADGQVFKLPANFDAASLQVGQEVTITYEAGADGSMEASAVAPAS